MKKILLVFALFIYSNDLLSQSYLDEFDHIPLITYGWGSDQDWLDWYDFDSIKSMGSDIYFAPDLWAAKFELLRQADLKIIPYQKDTTGIRVNYITKYTDAIYSIWEGEIVPASEGEIQLTRNLNLVNNSSEWIITKSNTPGYILYGPNYLHRLEYGIEPEPIDYRIDFRMKVEPTTAIPVPLANNEDNICRIEVITTDKEREIDFLLDEKIIQASEFNNYGEWGEFRITYSKNNNISKDNGTPPTIYNFYVGPENSEVQVYENIQFKVYYYGTQQDYLSLYVDKILVNDVRGQELFEDLTIQSKIVDQANNIGDGVKFTTDSTYFNNTVVGWYAADEPNFIDNWACVKKVGQLLKDNTNGKKLITSIAGSFNGMVWEGSNVFRVDELMKRTGLEEVIMNNFLFDYPRNEGQTDYQAYNIENMLLNHLDRLNNFNVPFVLNLQVGKWGALDDHLEKIPTSEQFKNSMFLGLLYGAKGLALNDYFYKTIFQNDRTALFNITSSVYQPLWFTVRDEVSPLLKGNFGQIIKQLDRKYQGFNYNANSANIISDNYWVKKIEVPYIPSGGIDDLCFVDYGFFEDSNDLEKKYLMIVNRYYSTENNFIVTLRNLNTYYNWEVNNLITNNTQTITTSPQNEQAFSDVINEGEAGFFSILPVLKYGGNLVYDDTVSTAVILSKPMTIKPNTDLTIEALYTVDSDLYVEDGGKIDVKWYYGNIDITVNGSIEFEEWSDCLIGAKTTDLHHPRLIFNEYNSSYLQYYKIYKKYGSSAWAVIDTTSSTSYTDLNTTIVQPGGMGGVDVKFKICAVIKIKNVTYEEFTNEVTYPTSGQEIEKKDQKIMQAKNQQHSL